MHLCVPYAASVHVCTGGLYADLDLTALRSVTPLLQDADVLLAANDTKHAANTGCKLRRPCGTSLGNAFMATTRRHPFWLAYFAHVAKHVDRFCQNARRPQHLSVWHTVELTGPYALGHAFEAFQRTHSAAYQGVRTLPYSRAAPLYRSGYAASWMGKGKLKPRPIGEFAQPQSLPSRALTALKRFFRRFF